jgi:hypothetical protein
MNARVSAMKLRHSHLLIHLTSLLLNGLCGLEASTFSSMHDLADGPPNLRHLDVGGGLTDESNGPTELRPLLCRVLQSLPKLKCLRPHSCLLRQRTQMALKT